jgi:hypothetical protein
MAPPGRTLSFCTNWGGKASPQITQITQKQIDRINRIDRRKDGGGFGVRRQSPDLSGDDGALDRVYSFTGFRVSTILVSDKVSTGSGSDRVACADLSALFEFANAFGVHCRCSARR